MFLRQKVIQKMIILQKLGIMITVNYDYYQKTSQKNAQIKKDSDLGFKTAIYFMNTRRLKLPLARFYQVLYLDLNSFFSEYLINKHTQHNHAANSIR